MNFLEIVTEEGDRCYFLFSQVERLYINGKTVTLWLQGSGQHDKGEVENVKNVINIDTIVQKMTGGGYRPD